MAAPNHSETSKLQGELPRCISAFGPGARAAPAAAKAQASAEGTGLRRHHQADHSTRLHTHFSPGISRRFVSPVQLISKSCSKKGDTMLSKLFPILQSSHPRLFLHKQNPVLQLVSHSDKHPGRRRAGVRRAACRFVW